MMVRLVPLGRQFDVLSKAKFVRLHTIHAHLPHNILHERSDVFFLSLKELCIGFNFFDRLLDSRSIVGVGSNMHDVLKTLKAFRRGTPERP